MIVQQRAQPSEESHPTVWGLTPIGLHDRFWASRGVQVVRPGVEVELVQGAELYLLMPVNLLTVFRLRSVTEHMSWIRPALVRLRLHDVTEHAFRETPLSDAAGRFTGFHRDYGGRDTRLARAVATSSPKIAQRWKQCNDAREGWRLLRSEVSPRLRDTLKINARTFDHNQDIEAAAFVRLLVQRWRQPDMTIDHLHRLKSGAWVYETSNATTDARIVGSAWIGAGRSIEPGATVVGPAILWDEPDARPEPDIVDWEDLEPTEVLQRATRITTAPTNNSAVKRIFDLTLATFALIVLSPLFPLIILAIHLEDGRPWFFTHERETVGGRIFPCLKFRSMKRNAPQLKAQLAAENEVDGPQFFIHKDPRLTRVGAQLRRYHIDELPQLFNVLTGDMSLVGPRPSPCEENQYCPAWREARLSIRPGITGLWQIRRTRAKGVDFQEWIRYDIEYIERSSLLFDIQILLETLRHSLR